MYMYMSPTRQKKDISTGTLISETMSNDHKSSSEVRLIIY